MKVIVFNRQKDLPLRVTPVKSVVNEVIARENMTTDEVAIYFVSTKEIVRLHQEFFNDPTPTDCISFPLDGTEKISGYHTLGEVFICPKTAIEYSKNSLEKAYIETTLYVVHGLLHLIGYDDIDEKKRRKMRKAEKTHMINLTQKKLLLKAG